MYKLVPVHKVETKFYKVSQTSTCISDAASEIFRLPVVGVEIELELVENRYCLSQQLLLVAWLVELELGLGKLFEHVLLHLLWL